MTTHLNESCPAEKLVKILSGKWKAQIFKLAAVEILRFNALVKSLEGANKQSVATALKELCDDEILRKVTVREKPLHIEYHITEKGISFIPLLEQMEGLME